MKSFKRSISLAVIALVAICAVMPAAAQFRFGLKAGVAINNLKFDSAKDFGNSVLDESNRAGFVGGAMVEFTVPLIGVGLDASVLYVHRSSTNKINNEESTLNRDYIDIPVNLKYKLSIPVIEKVIKPFVTTGPSFAFLASKKEINEFIKNKSVDIAWNFGFGVELLSHVQVSASYGLGLTKALEVTGISQDNTIVEGKNRYWTVTAAYLF